MTKKIILLALSILYLEKMSAQPDNSLKFADGFYSGEKQGLVSTAAFRINLKGDTAYLEQFRVFGGVLYRDLLDTLYKQNDQLYAGKLTLMQVIDNKPVLTNIPDKLRWKLKVKLLYNNEARIKGYGIYKNRMLLDSVDYKNADHVTYKILVDKAFIMDHDSFRIEVKKFKEQFYPSTNIED